MKTIKYSDDKKWYYVAELVCGYCNWISTNKFAKKPESSGFVSHIYQYDNSYFRKALPFAFWKVRQSLHLEEQVPDNHELVKDYIGCGTHVWCPVCEVNVKNYQRHLKSKKHAWDLVKKAEKI